MYGFLAPLSDLSTPTRHRISDNRHQFGGMTLKLLLEGIQLYREFRDANALLSLGPVSRLLQSRVGPTVFFFRRTCFSTGVLTHLGQLLHARICIHFVCAIHTSRRADVCQATVPADAVGFSACVASADRSHLNLSYAGCRPVRTDRRAQNASPAGLIRH